MPRAWIGAIAAVGWALSSPVAGTAAPAVTTPVNCATANLQTAITAAAAGDVLVITGMCSNAVSGGTAFTVDKTLTLESAPGASATLEPSGAGRVLEIESGTVTLIGITITGGQAAIVGGGIANVGGNLTIVSSDIVGNSVTTVQAEGGGIYTAGALTISGSTISGNTTMTTNALTGFAYGAGIYDAGPELTLTNTTITGNENLAFTGQTKPDEGAGLYVSPGSATVTLTNVTVSGNESYGGTSGYVGNGSASEGSLQGSIIYGNTNTQTAAEADCVGGGRSFGYNVLGTSCGLEVTDASDVVGEAPLLGSLGSNGGPTPTMVPTSGSPAINLIPTATCTTFLGSNPLDQRGVVRPQGAGCDAGAVEVAPSPVANNDAYTGSENATLTVSAANGVLANDTTTTGGDLTATQASATSHGSVTLNSDGAFSYTPGSGFTGTDSFTYTATDPLTDEVSASATVTLNVLIGQTITFTAPASGTVGGSATLSGTGGGSGNPVLFSVDASSGAGVCNVSGSNGSTVHYTAPGNCVIDANQAGNATYAAAAQVQGTTVVSGVGSSITVTSPATGASWAPKSSHAITWSSAGSPGTHVKIELLKAGKVVKTIKASVLTSAATYTWKIPTTLAKASTYQIKIISTTTPSIFGISGDFTIS